MGMSSDVLILYKMKYTRVSLQATTTGLYAAGACSGDVHYGLL